MLEVCPVLCFAPLVFSDGFGVRGTLMGNRKLFLIQKEIMFKKRI